MYSQNGLAYVRLRKDLADCSRTLESTNSSIAVGLLTSPSEPAAGVSATVTLKTGLWKSAKFTFLLRVPKMYPFSPPTLHATFPIYHPNISLATGHVRLPILSPQTWRPVLSIGNVFQNLEMCFMEPFMDDDRRGEDTGEGGRRDEFVENKEAAVMFRENREEFCNIVHSTLLGGFYFSTSFPPCLRTFGSPPLHPSSETMNMVEPIGLGSPAKYFTNKRKYSEEDFENSQQSLDRMHISAEDDDFFNPEISCRKRFKVGADDPTEI
ncbi:hypothetical protein TrST_g12150 [Triparma strigata]|uniref:UBC core domain-containing protein n=2 Tax=Triparma TaxID=722752 RepID=A0A9W7AY70_9STRA|nr:hypothetical protein TrST_g12150 [Triparma strigata]